MMVKKCVNRKEKNPSACSNFLWKDTSLLPNLDFIPEEGAVEWIGSIETL